MAQATVDWQALEAARRESEAVATLHRLNARSIRAFADSDIAWYGEHLGDDFVCTLADGQRVNRAEFLRRVREGTDATDVGHDEIDVHVLGEVALVHGVTHFVRNGLLVVTRYTTVWQLRQGRWRAVAAQLTEVR
jgi:ketosteroid isomerase-like protein